jgi:hypothetical protein
MRIFGLLLVVTGLIFCLTIIGAPFGIFLIFVGLIFIALGGRRRTYITNVIQVSNTSGPAPEAKSTVRTLFGRKSEAAKQIDYVDVTPKQSPQHSFDARGADRLEAQLTSGRRFQAIETELTQNSINILRAAHADGYDVDFKRGRNWIIVKLGEEMVYLCSNEDIQSFGYERRYVS